MEEIRVSGENHRPVASHWQTLSHNQHYVIKFVSHLPQVGGFLYTTLFDKVCQWLATGRWFSLYNIIVIYRKSHHLIIVVLTFVRLQYL
jgi:hypothetical protein